MARAEQPQPHDSHTRMLVELDMWLSTFAASLPIIDESYVKEKLAEQKRGNLGVQVAKIVYDEWEISESGRDFEEFGSYMGNGLIYSYATEPLIALIDAIDTLRTGGPPIDNFVPLRHPDSDDPDDMLEDLLNPENNLRLDIILIF